MLTRPRRLRQNELVRSLVAEARLNLSQLIQPYFIASKKDAVEPITGFSDVSRLGIDPLSERIEKDMEYGLRNFLFFGKAIEKDAIGSEATEKDSLIPSTLSQLRKRFGKEAFLVTDVCLCPFTDHGHCGLKKGQTILNDSSLERLASMALVHAEAGADFVAPSDMMDGRVATIRQKLDTSGYTDVGILSYTAKYASNYYGPFREALHSAPEEGSDRASYQMDFRNRAEALKELRLDEAEGADIVMVKPALAYLDIISDFSRASHLPVAAYSVSGEYEMVKCLAKNGLADEKKLALENLTAIRRAGASIIITYFATKIAEQKWLTQ